jgi:hypothetical protein
VVKDLGISVGEIRMIRLFSIITSVVLVGSCSVTNDFRTARSKLQEMKTIAILVFPGAIEVGANERSGAGTAILGKRYKSSVPYEDLKKFYLEKLPAEGWQFHADRPMPASNASTGERLLEFCRGEYWLNCSICRQGCRIRVGLCRRYCLARQ